MRNDIEHYYTNAGDAAIKGVISDSFILVRDFLALELRAEPVETLGQATWNSMLAVSEVMEKERKACAAALESANWDSQVLSDGVKDLSCEACASPLLIPSDASRNPDLVCRSCGTVEAQEDYAARALHERLAAESFRAIRDGLDDVYVTCPFCHRDAYVVAEQMCAACGESCVHECSRCGEEIPACELSDGSYCSWCAHMASKD